MDFPRRRGHQSPFTAWLAGPAESGSQVSDAGTLAGEEERGGYTAQAVGRPRSLQPRGGCWREHRAGTQWGASLRNGEGSLPLLTYLFPNSFFWESHQWVPPEEATCKAACSGRTAGPSANTEQGFLRFSYCSTFPSAPRPKVLIPHMWNSLLGGLLGLEQA